MKKILSVLLIISVMLTFSISTAFADVSDYKSAEVKTAVETAIAAVNNSDYTKSTAEMIERDKTDLRDAIKNEWAIKNNIPLVRIPYWERDNITLEMIMGDQYLI